MTRAASPARPVHVRSQTRADEVRRVAAELFVERGYSSTRMCDIADAAGLRTSALYYHFASKEDLAIELLDEFHRALADGVAEAKGLGPGEPAERRIRALVTSWTRAALDHPAAARLSAFEAPSAATGRLAAAWAPDVSDLDKAWLTAAGDLRATPGYRERVDPGLLAYWLGRISSRAPISYLMAPNAAEIAPRVCDVLLHGVTTRVPDFAELDRSAAFTTALEIIDSWHRGATPSDPDGVYSAAATEFARRGYRATTVRDIAQAAGVSMASLYRRVESKQAMLQGILDGYTQRIDTALASVSAASVNAPDLLNALARLWTSASSLFRHEKTAIVALDGNLAGAVSEFDRGRRERSRRLGRILADGMRDGSLVTAYPPDELAMHVRAIMWTSFDRRPATGPQEAFTFVRECLLAGALRADDSPPRVIKSLAAVDRPG